MAKGQETGEPEESRKLNIFSYGKEVTSRGGDKVGRECNSVVRIVICRRGLEQSHAMTDSGSSQLWRTFRQIFALGPKQQLQFTSSFTELFISVTVAERHWYLEVNPEIQSEDCQAERILVLRSSSKVPGLRLAFVPFVWVRGTFIPSARRI